MNIRNYNPATDYPGLKELYLTPHTFGGQFDEARDSQQRIGKLATEKPGSILVVNLDDQIIGSVTLFEDGRSAWLYRFAVLPEYEPEVSALLWKQARETMKKWGHEEVLVYAPEGEEAFQGRYADLGFTKGGNYTAYWQGLN